jgi:hypothetical protein
MLVSVWGKRWKEVYLVMFTVYIDDSGSDPNQPVANATALIVPGRRILALQREWDSLKGKEGFTDFHTSIFVARNHHSEFADWSDTKQKRVFLRVRQIVKKYGAQIVSFTVHKKDYDEVIPAELRKYAGKYHYSWAIRHVMTHLSAWRISHKVALPFEYIFDNMKRDERRREIETVMEQAERNATDMGMSGEYVNYGFRRRQDIPGLQCVDCAAWTTYQYGLLAFRKKPVDSFAEIAWNDFCSRNDNDAPAGPLDWFNAIAIKREHLAAWVQKEALSGISIARFKKWEEEDAAAKRGV